MAEHDAERGEPDEKGVPVGEPLGDEQGVPFDEDAAWQAIVAGYGEEPPDPPGAKPFKSIEDLALLDPVTNDAPGGGDAPERPEKGKKNGTGGSVGTSEKDGAGDEAGEPPAAAKPLGGSVSFAPGVGGPRDYQAPEHSEDDFDGDDEGHFVPPEPPPLPTADTTAKFAWLAVVGGPIVLLLTILLGWDMTWWLATVGIGGFLGGFATLVARMKTDDEDEDDPGRGAVV
ncbi:hypothetical protein ACFRH4_48120 [Streptomyces mirabilis]|uniref:hypothetical protein n=1 Tax=Streptomyces mirabilis TaxID=68239 RepID=UPI0036BD1F01